MSQRLRWTLWLGVCVLGRLRWRRWRRWLGQQFRRQQHIQQLRRQQRLEQLQRRHCVEQHCGRRGARACRGEWRYAQYPVRQREALQPGTSTCATIDDVLVDTGSVGLRLMASALAAASLSLTDTADASVPGNSIAECCRLPMLHLGPGRARRCQHGG